MKKIIFLDLDGTLWTFEKIPSSALKAIELARKNGHKIYINTGRTRCEIPQFLLDMNLDGYCFGAGSEIIIKNSIFRNSLIFQGLPPIKYQNLMYFPLFLPL